MNKYLRTDEELIYALERHVALLSDFYIQCFHAKNQKYFGEVAGKLRLLVCDTRSNTALLLHLARQYSIESKYRIGKSGVVSEYEEGPTLTEYLEREDLHVRVGEEMVPVSNKKEILYYAEKEGSAHEDLEHPEILYMMKLPSFQVNGISAYQAKIENTARYVIAMGNLVLKDIHESRLRHPA